jgi:hypothetical protein
LRDPARVDELRTALVAARDDAAPDWNAIGAPVAALLDDLPLRHPQPGPAPHAVAPPTRAEIERIIRTCVAHLRGSFRKNDFIPAYVAFNLLGDPDLRGREFLMALTGINARTYKNSTLLFNLVRPFVAHSPAAALVNPPWTGIAEPIWEPVKVRHRSAYYDAYFAEALMDYLGSGLATADETPVLRDAVGKMIGFCLRTSREEVREPGSGRRYDAITPIAPAPHARISRFFRTIRSDLGFEVLVPDSDTVASAISAATQFGSRDSMLDQPLIDLFAAYQVAAGDNGGRVTVPINDNIAFDGGILTWLENAAGERPFGNDLDPTLGLDVLEMCLRNHDRWGIVATPERIAMLRGIVGFQRRLAESGAFAVPRSHIYYLPELYCAYFGRCHAAFRALPPAVQTVIDPDGGFAAIRREVLAYVTGDLIAAEMNVFDAALALLALAKLGADPDTFHVPLACIAHSVGEGGRSGPFKAYEWNKMKTPTRMVIGGPEVTSAFVLSALVHARKAMMSMRAESRRAD